MAVRVDLDENEDGHGATCDESRGRRYSVLGPSKGGSYVAWDKAAAAELGVGTRDEMIGLVERQDPETDHLDH